MKNIKTVFLKELRRFFTDRRMLIALFLPGVIIAIFYTAMGRFITSSIVTSTAEENITYNIAYSDNSGAADPTVGPRIIQAFDLYVANKEKTNKITYHTFPLADLEAEKAKVINGTYDVLIAFSDNFDTVVHDAPGNHIDFYYYGASKKATNAYSVLTSLVRASYDYYQVNIDKDQKPIPANLAPSDYLGNRIMSIIFPMVTVSLLFSTVVSICPDSVAGEKERGTLAAMLLTPIKRKELALGKSLALLLTSLASGAVSFAGIAISLPQMMNGKLSLALDGWSYTLLGLMVVTTLTLFVGIGILVSTLTKSTKEASSYLGPMTVVFVALSVVSGSVDTSSIGFAFIPFLNVTSCMGSILQGSISVPFFAITIGMSVIETILLVIASTHLFSSERVMIK